MFIDELDITIKAGNGGDGVISFLREKRRPHGGPAGGDGGRGGNVVLRATRNRHTLFHLSHFQLLVAENGAPGGKKNMSGKGGESLILDVPVGTLICRQDTGELIADLSDDQATCIAARGGKGGWGNQHFATPQNRAPRIADKGRPGAERHLHLELKLIAHAGLVGLPNAGKSSLLRRISAAKPKVADYPFTTREPHLGIFDAGDFTQIVVADIPGLIEGAHEGAGMGDAFLRHIERTMVLVHMVDCCPPDQADPADAFRVIERELLEYSPELAAKPRIVAANKMDLAGADIGLELLREVTGDLPVIPLSTATRMGISDLMARVLLELNKLETFTGLKP